MCLLARLAYAPTEKKNKYLNTKTAVEVKTQKDWDRVTKEVGYCEDENPDFDYRYSPCLYLDKEYWHYSDYAEKLDYKIISTAEFFGEESEVTREDMMSGRLSECAIEASYTGNTNIINKPNIIKKSMSLIKNAMKSKEDKALEYFELGDTKDLNDAGRVEFTDFIFETGKTDRKEFLDYIVGLHKEKTK